MNIKKKAAFGAKAQSSARKNSKGKRKGKKKMTPVSRKGKSKFRY